MPEAHWLAIDDERAPQVLAKDEVLAEHRDQVYEVLPRGRAAATQVRDLVAEFLCRQHPKVLRRTPDGVEDSQVGRIVAFGDEPLIDAARVVAEDLVVMSPEASGEWTMTAACVCFPSRWDLRTKIGRGLSAIHEPVPFYEQRAASAVRALFDRLTERPVVRFNWTLLDSPSLFQPGAGWGSERPASAQPPVDGEGDPGAALDLGDRLWSRIERQTMRRLPGGEVLFTIRTTVRPLRHLRREDPTLLDAVAHALESTQEATIDYKHLAGVLPMLVSWLRSSGVEGAPDSRGRECDSAPPTRSVP